MSSNALIATQVVLQVHIDAAFSAFDLDFEEDVAAPIAAAATSDATAPAASRPKRGGKLYLGDAVLALDSLLTACWGKDAAAGEKKRSSGAGGASSNGGRSQSPPPPTSSDLVVNSSFSGASKSGGGSASSGSGISAEALTLPGISRSKILQALKNALYKAGVNPDASVSDAPIITKAVFDSAAHALLAPLPGVRDASSFSAFQSVNQSSEATRVNKRALRRALFAEYDADIYAVADEEDELDARLRSASAGSIGSASTMLNNSSNGRRSAGGAGSKKFDGYRNLVGCDELLLARFAAYPSQGLSFDEWRAVVAPVASQGKARKKAAAGAAAGAGDEPASPPPLRRTNSGGVSVTA